jgi:hypothetical protein
MLPFSEFKTNITRRHFFAQGSHALGGAALASLMAASPSGGQVHGAELVGKQHFAGKAKHVIYLHMVGGPAQMDLFDY